MPSDRSDRAEVLRALHRFFERRLSSLEAGDRQPEICVEAKCRYAVGHLVEQTVARASLLATIHRSAPAPSTGTPWKYHLMTAALTELRTLDL